MNAVAAGHASRAAISAAIPRPARMGLAGGRVVPLARTWAVGARAIRSTMTAQRQIAVAGRGQLKCSAAAAGGADPYKVLGLSPDADSREIGIAYRQKMQLAKGDPEKEAVIEAANNSLMMASLNARLSGKAPVDKSIQFADKRVWFPWGPRPCRAENKDIYINAGILAVFLMFAGVAKSIQPAVFASIVFLVRLNTKVMEFIPSPGGGDEKKTADNKRFVRSVSLIVGGLVAGIITVTAIPQQLASLFYFPLPRFLVATGLKNAVTSAVCIVYMFLLATFYR